MKITTTVLAGLFGTALASQGAVLNFNSLDADGAQSSANVDGGNIEAFDLSSGTDGNSTVFTLSKTANLDGGALDDTLSFELVYTIYTGSSFSDGDVTLGSSVAIATSNLHFGQGYTGDPDTNFLEPGNSFTLSIRNISYTDGEGDETMTFVGFNHMSKFGAGTEDFYLGTIGYTTVSVGGTGAEVNLGGLTDVTLTTSITAGTANQRLRDLDFSFETAAVPEPSSFALLAGCFALTSIMVRRRRVH